ncbi:hypothetical protein EMIT0P74_60009 [Pseudomonas sp. IT-P74]
MGTKPGNMPPYTNDLSIPFFPQVFTDNFTVTVRKNEKSTNRVNVIKKIN